VDDHRKACSESSVDYIVKDAEDITYRGATGFGENGVTGDCVKG
jgi:hypothetical protein